jgi:hypothetical protein
VEPLKKGLRKNPLISDTSPQPMEQPQKSQWCLYLPGHCIHSAPAGYGAEELHLNREDLQSDFKFHPYIQPLEPPEGEHPSFRDSSLSKPPTPAIIPDHTMSNPGDPDLADLARLISYDKAFENTSTSVAASQMRNALNNLADTVKDAEHKKVRSSSFQPLSALC